jgi:hypothetical protein
MFLGAALVSRRDMPVHRATGIVSVQLAPALPSRRSARAWQSAKVGKLNDPPRALRLQSGELDGPSVGTADRLNSAADEDRARLEIDVFPGKAEDLRATGSGHRGEQDR